MSQTAPTIAPARPRGSVAAAITARATNGVMQAVASMPTIVAEAMAKGHTDAGAQRAVSVWRLDISGSGASAGCARR